MKNITITVPESVAKWAPVWAVRHGTSISKIVEELLVAKMKEETAYEAAQEGYLSKAPQKIRRRGARYPKKADLHNR